jgi:superfamily II DNA or RNA helicase
MASSIRLRPWQRAALDRLASSSSADFLAVATPGAGKTTFALSAARRLLAEHPARLVVVVPTAHLRMQWAGAAAALDLHLETSWSPKDGGLAPDMHGLVTTYQQVASAARALQPIASGAVVILDEIHHAGDERAWGDGLVVAFANAHRRLLLSGTPFRSDAAPIPFVNYIDDEARPDFEYGYGPALAEHRVVRPVYFPRTNGFMEWSAPDGSVMSASFDDALDAQGANQRLRAALSAEGEWLPEVLRVANQRLVALRQHHHDAGGLVIATDQDHARAIAQILERRLGSSAVIAVSDDPTASARIRDFSRSSAPWLVAVRMVSEGVDIPRLRVGVFATTTTTELFFRQAVGRLVRWQSGLGRQGAYLFIPDDVRLRKIAATIIEDRRHYLRRREAMEASERLEAELRGEVARDEQLSMFAVISAVATDAVFPDDPGGEEPGGTEEDPALTLELPAPPPLVGAAPSGGELRAELKERLRNDNAAAARALAQITGISHAKVNAELNRRSGVRSVAEATVGQLESRLAHANRWLAHP